MKSKLIQRQENYIRIGSTHMWFNPTATNYHQVDDNRLTREDDVHIYLTKIDVVTDELQEFIRRFFKNKYNFPAVTIHIPKYVKDHRTILEDYMFSDSFKLDDDDIIHIDVEYMMTEIKVSVRRQQDIFMGWITGYPGIIRYTIIQNFKRCCPKEILEMFENDAEIWEYITKKANV